MKKWLKDSKYIVKKKIRERRLRKKTKGKKRLLCYKRPRRGMLFSLRRIWVWPLVYMETFKIHFRVARQEFSPRSNPCSMTQISKMQGNWVPVIRPVALVTKKDKEGHKFLHLAFIGVPLYWAFQELPWQGQAAPLGDDVEALHKLWKWSHSRSLLLPVGHLAPENFIYRTLLR